ncbi:MAG TPA: Glu/Leu/Phe/Val dehydrogenase dimerization domain-containing protein [Candidatus Binatia bacterium]|nr:Glu/Leu/Phe/Val dehydrogenase dimerization domain-containing protein [Candidatus Binatia bacterium]
MEREGHEEVVFCRDRSTGLRAIVSIHDTTLGPGLGGVRMRAYDSESDALADVLRLSEAMSLKASLAGLEFGGGKSVILGAPKAVDRPALFRAMGRFIDSLGGRYIPTEDLGTYTADIEHLRETSRFGVGVAESLGGGGDPSPMTAWGVVCGMRAAIDAANLPTGLRGKRVVVQGVGKVGLALLRYLLEGGADVRISDVDAARAEEARRLGAQVVANEAVHREPCDILSPCATGGLLNERTIPELGCRIVAGGANNQLATLEDDERLKNRGILYAPDFAINAGGLINVADELGPGGYDRSRALAATERIEPTLRRIFADSARRGVPPGALALRLARERIAARRRAGS